MVRSAIGKTDQSRRLVECWGCYYAEGDQEGLRVLNQMRKVALWFWGKRRALQTRGTASAKALQPGHHWAVPGSSRVE
jgi:hypothetical protein